MQNPDYCLFTDLVSVPLAYRYCPDYNIFAGYSFGNVSTPDLINICNSDLPKPEKSKISEMLDTGGFHKRLSMQLLMCGGNGLYGLSFKKETPSGVSFLTESRSSSARDGLKYSE